MRTRRIWNQHTYHVTNVDEDGRVPALEARNWDNPSLNNFRQNVQPGGLFDAPDLTATLGTVACGSYVEATALVKNQGAAKVVAGLEVSLYAKDAQGTAALQTVPTKTTLYPGGTETVSFSVKTPAAYATQTIEFYVKVDDDGSGGGGTANECNEANNQSATVKAECKPLR